MRKVKYSKYKDGNWTHNIEGFFHQFGTDYEEFENGAANYPIAIVERLDGVVEIVHASDVVFLDTLSWKNKEW